MERGSSSSFRAYQSEYPIDCEFFFQSSKIKQGARAPGSPGEGGKVRPIDVNSSRYNTWQTYTHGTTRSKQSAGIEAAGSGRQRPKGESEQALSTA